MNRFISNKPAIPNADKNFVALVFGTHINSHSIIQGLLNLGIKAQNICLIIDKADKLLSARFFNHSLPYLVLDIFKAIDLPGKLRERFGIKTTKVLFFTDERYLAAMSAARQRNEVPDFLFFSGSDMHLETILDRLKFYRYIEKNNLATVPKTISGNKKPFKILGNRFLVRPNISWLSLRIRHTVSIISNKADLEKITNLYIENGMQPTDWSYQEVLSLNSKNNISVCGWFDNSNNHVFCTRKVLQHPEGCGDGDVIELIKNPPTLIMDQSKSLLNALKYEGPFELEWIYDEDENVYKVIELNPRFWMQHSLVGKISKQSIIMKNMGHYYKPNHYTLPDAKNVRFWVNPLYALFRLLKGDFRGLHFYFKRNATSPISLTKALIYSPTHFLNTRNL